MESLCECRDLWGNPYVGKGTQVVEASCPVHGSKPQSSLFDARRLEAEWKALCPHSCGEVAPSRSFGDDCPACDRMAEIEGLLPPEWLPS